MIPKPVYARYMNQLKAHGVPVEQHQEYLKWLRYYLDFCCKYLVTHDQVERLRLFQTKLKQKRQSDKQCEAAAHAVSLYCEIENHQVEHSPALEAEKVKVPILVHPAFASQRVKTFQQPSQYSVAGYLETSDSPEWDEVLEKLADEIKVRHYSRKTLKTYAHWSRQFQKFLKNKHPEELSTADVKSYLTWLAVKCHVAASTQNQAFNSLLFLFRHALKREFGELRDVPRAKKSLYIPVVLSREEIDAIVQHLYHPYSLIVKLLFGCGLRLFECLQLRGREQVEG